MFYYILPNLRLYLFVEFLALLVWFEIASLQGLLPQICRMGSFSHFGHNILLLLCSKSIVHNHHCCRHILIFLKDNTALYSTLLYCTVTKLDESIRVSLDNLIFLIGTYCNFSIQNDIPYSHFRFFYFYSEIWSWRKFLRGPLLFCGVTGIHFTRPC